MSLFGYWYCVSHEWLFPWFSLVWDWVHAQQGNTIQHMRERLPQLASAFLTNPIQDHHLIKNIQKIIKSTKLNHHSFLLDHHNIRLKVYLFIKKRNICGKWTMKRTYFSNTQYGSHVCSHVCLLCGMYTVFLMKL